MSTSAAGPPEVDDDETSVASGSGPGQAGAEQLTTGTIWAYSTPRIGMGIMGLLRGASTGTASP